MDRNVGNVRGVLLLIKSLSARRAWIEMFRPPKKNRPSVGRSPQGERG